MTAVADLARAVIGPLEAEYAYQQRQRPPVLPPPALAWAEQNATLVLPTEGRQPFRPFPYQATVLADRSPRRLVLKARQVGMSNAIAIEALYLAITRPGQMILMVSRNGRLAQQLITYCRHTLGGLRNIPQLEQENLSELAFANDSRIISLPAGPSAGRGFPASAVYLDEFAFTEYAQFIYDSIEPTLSGRGQFTILSTANGQHNLFYRLWAGLEGGEWSRHRIHWSDCPRYDADWAERTRAGMTDQAFAQEYDLDFVTSGDAPLVWLPEWATRTATTQTTRR